MARWNQGLGMWVASDGSYHSTKEAAEAAEGASPADDGALDSTEFREANRAPTTARAPETEAPPAREPQTLGELYDQWGIDPSWTGSQLAPSGSPEAMRQAHESGNIGGASGAWDVWSDEGKALWHLENSPAGAFGGFDSAQQDLVTRIASGDRNYSGFDRDATIRSQGTAPPGGTDSQRTSDAAADTDAAGEQFQDEHAVNAAENDNLFARAWDQYQNIGTDNTLGDEARQYQQEGLQMQRDLMDRILDFDRNQYATQFADQSLARMVAAGRSQPGGYAAQQAGINTALEQAPALFAEGERQAANLEAQRLAQASGVAKSFGDLGTMTRGQDEQRSQFEANLSLNIADGISRLTQGKMQLNQRESEIFADIWMKFAQLESVYAGMDSAEKMAWWDREMAEAGMQNQFEMLKYQIKEGGKVADKDILGGIFGLAGDALKVGGTLAVAGMA